MDKLKKILEEKSEVITIVRLSMLTLVLIGVAYTALLQDRSKETIFVQPTVNSTRVIVLDHIIKEGLKTDSIIKTEYYEIPDYSNASADSLEKLITERYKKR
jgi:hypothetical protein